MALKIRAQPNINFPGFEKNIDLSKRFKSAIIWQNKPASEAVTTNRKHKDAHSKGDERRIIHDRLEYREPDEQASQEILEDEKIKPLSNPSDPYDDFNLFWNPRELLDALKALAFYDVKDLYKKNTYTVKNALYLIFLIIKYKPLLKDLLQVAEYFQRFPEDTKDEIIVIIALFDILCRGNGTSLENEMDASLRTEYKNIGLKVVYMQVEKDKLHYFEQVHERLDDIGASSVYNLLPTSIPLQINIGFPMIFDVWINKTKIDIWPEEILEGAGFKRASTRTSSGMTYNEIVDLPYFFELGVSNYADFVKTSHYCNHVLIPTDRNDCLAMAQVIKQLYKGGITKGTVIQTHILSLGSTAYFAYLLSIAFPSTVKLKVFGADHMKESFESYFALLNLKNVKVFKERFYIVNCRKKDIASTTCVLINPETVFNPSLNLINETMKRGCDIVYLQSAYELFSENDTFDNSFINQYTHDLKELAKCNIQRALSIPKVKFVVYQSFDTRETADDNLALYVVNFARECSHTSVVSIKGNMSTTEMEDANYKYCKQLNLYFRQGNTPNSIVSPALWGSKPPFITTIYRVNPVILDSGTEGEKYVERKTSARSFSSRTPPYSQNQHLNKFPSLLNSATSDSWITRNRNDVDISVFSGDSNIQKKSISSKMNIKSSKARRRRQNDSKISKPSNKSNLQMVNENIFETYSRRGSEKIGLSSAVSSGKRSSMTLLQVRESPPDFKKMVLSKVIWENEETPIPSEKENPVLKKILKNKRYKKKKFGEKKEVLFSDEVENINSEMISGSDKSYQNENIPSRSLSHYETKRNTEVKNPMSSKRESFLEEDFSLRDEVQSVDVEVQSVDSQENSELTKLSLNKGKKTRSPQNVETNVQNKRLSKKMPSKIKNKSDKESKMGPSSSKYFTEGSEKKGVKKKKKEHRRTSKKMDDIKDEQTVFAAQHSPVNVKKVIDSNSKAKAEKILKKSYKTKQSKVLPRNYLKDKKEPPIISFGTIIRPKSTPNQQSEKQNPLEKKNTTAKKKADVNSQASQQKFINKQLDRNKKNYREKRPSVTSQEEYKKKDNSSIKTNYEERSMKFHVNRSKTLNEMQKRFKKEIKHSFQTSFFHTMKQSDFEEKSNNAHTRPSSSVSYRTYAKTARKLSELNLIKLLKKVGSQKEAKRKNTGSRRTHGSSSSIYTESDVEKITDDKESKFSRKRDNALWTEYKASDFDKLMKIDKNEFRSFLNSSYIELDKSDKISLTSSILEMNQKELRPSVDSSHSAESLNTNEGKASPKRKKTTKNKRKLKKKRKNKKSKNESGNFSDDSDEGSNRKAKSKTSLIKVILEHSEGTQTKPLRKTPVYHVGTQADQLEIYMSLTHEEENKKNLQFYTDLVGNVNSRSVYSGVYSIPSEPNMGRERQLSVEATIMKKGELKPDKEHGVTVSKMISWFRKLESQAPIPPRVVSYILRRRNTMKKSDIMGTSEKSEITSEDDSQDMIEEGVDDISSLNQDYKIEDAQTILAQMKMYDEGERNLNKLISTDITDFVDFSLLQIRHEDEEGSNKGSKEKLPVPEAREEIVALNKNLLKYKADELSLESFTDDDGYEEEEPFNMETKGKEMNNLLVRLIDNIFETDTKVRRTTIDIDAVSTNSTEEVKKSVCQSRDLVDSEEQLQSPSIEEIWKNTTREAWNKRNKEMKKEPEGEVIKKEEVEEKEVVRRSDFDSEAVGTSIGEVVLRKTPTDGLSPLAKELYEIRDVIEFYLHSKVEPLDWRVMIDRHAED